MHTAFFQLLLQVKACGAQAEDYEKTILMFRKKVGDLNEEIQEHQDQVIYTNSVSTTYCCKGMTEAVICCSVGALTNIGCLGGAVVGSLQCLQAMQAGGSQRTMGKLVFAP